MGGHVKVKYRLKSRKLHVHKCKVTIKLGHNVTKNAVGDKCRAVYSTRHSHGYFVLLTCIFLSVVNSILVNNGNISLLAL
jgi:hypothetical protein